MTSPNGWVQKESIGERDMVNWIDLCLCYDLVNTV